MKKLLIILLVLIVILILGLLVFSQYADYRAEAEVSVWLIEVIPTQRKIEENAYKFGSLNNSALNVKLPSFKIHNVTFSKITKNGIILLKGGSKGQFISLIPSLKSGKVNWICIGGSYDDVLSQCHVNI